MVVLDFFVIVTVVYKYISTRLVSYQVCIVFHSGFQFIDVQILHLNMLHSVTSPGSKLKNMVQ